MSTELEADVAAVGRIPAVRVILDVVCRTTGMGFAAVARVTEDRWIACSVQDGIAFGLKPGGELKVETTICHEIRQHRQPVIIDNVAEDLVYCSHGTPATYGFQSYISVPILLPDGSFFGTLCAIDPKPHRLNTPEIVGMFELFAELIAFHLDATTRLARSEASLLEEREVAKLREQFIAVLGHDLRNPLHSISAGTELLLRRPQQAAAIAERIRQSIARMAGLIDNVLDFARGRLGSGVALSRDAELPVVPTLEQIIDEQRASWPDRRIEAALAQTEPVDCDRARIAQLFANLLSNALSHGAPDQPVRVSALTRDGVFELSVANRGAPIPAAAQAQLFEPFFRATLEASREGLGLGLYIAAEIARAHGGKIDVASSPDETRFTFRMPTRPAG
jgi:signal transduction histidine kinase